jgi:nitrogen fixation/metabolism regulation signal transduction histidine kinase
MTADAQRLSQTPRTHPPRKLRNFLLEPRFQLKYIAMVVSVTVAVAAVLGYYAYQYSRGQTEMLTITQIENEVGQGGAPDQAFIRDLRQYAEQKDREVMLAILGGIGVLALALGFTGIVITHRLVGPAYKLRMLLRRIADGHLRVESGLRKGDELQDVFDAFQRMVTGLRAAREQDIAELQAAIDKARQTATPSEVTAALEELSSRLRKSLE